MKKILLLGLLSTIGTSTFATSDCFISYDADDELTAIIREHHFEFDNYDAVCQHLQNANAIVSFTNSSAINTRQATAVVIATVKDKNLPIKSSLYSYSMWESPEQTTTVEKYLLMSAVNSALNRINQKDIESLNENRKKLGFQTYPVSTKSNKK